MSRKAGTAAAGAPSADQIDYLLACKSLREFARQAWHVVEPATPFVDGWHVGCIAEHLEALTALQLRKLIINIPPRHMKSLLVGVFWFCWAWAREPSSRWLFSSYGEDLSSRDSVRCRDVLVSPWYRQRWGGRVRLKDDQNVKTRFANDRQGWRIPTTVDGKATGEGGDYVVTDDPHKVQEARSDARRQAIVDFWTQAMSTRGNDPRTARHVVVMQRLHERDLTGYLLAERQGYEHLCLPCEYEPKRYFIPSGPANAPPKDAIIPTKLQRERPHLRDPRTEEGELLWPARFGPEEVRDLKAALQATGAAGQLQQRPAPADGTVFKEAFFKRFTVEASAAGDVVVMGVQGGPGDPPPARVPVARLRFFQCIDTASTTGKGSAFTTVGTFALTPSRHLLAWDIFRARLEVPEQFDALMRLREGPHLFARGEDGRGRLIACGGGWPKALMFQAVESQSSGIGLIQMGAAEGAGFHVLKADADKVERAGPVATMYYNGQVWHRSGAGWLAAFEDELLSFPSGAFKDQADVTAYAGICVTREKILTARDGADLVLSVPDDPPSRWAEDDPFPALEDAPPAADEALDADALKDAREALALYL